MDFCPYCDNLTRNLAVMRKDAVSGIVSHEGCWRWCTYCKKTVGESRRKTAMTVHGIFSRGNWPTDMPDDPTLPRVERECPCCGAQEAVAWYGDWNEFYTTRYYACVSCKSIEEVVGKVKRFHKFCF